MRDRSLRGTEVVVAVGVPAQTLSQWATHARVRGNLTEEAPAYLILHLGGGELSRFPTLVRRHEALASAALHGVHC